ncbi:hypothetical protein [Kribbella speibonae]|uniref:Uncharacterized protein n=1 Tax=Kribbella speibonae TaxID=1572660 RepID=A0A4R0ISW3_9ACTN|nr:hypothetical protein [Kribbella speibonae]TCC36269.1 hypothetical protein E0H92_26815 [Kribbella speibonae]
MFDLDVFTAADYHSECAAWPAPPTGKEPWLAEVEDLLKTLVVSDSVPWRGIPDAAFHRRCADLTWPRRYRNAPPVP